MNLDNSHVAFFALVKAGLWEDIKVNGEGLKVNDFPINLYSSVDWQDVMRIAEEQSVGGLMTAGIEANTNRTDGTNINIPQEWRLRFVGSTLNTEQRNKAMNAFVAELIEKLRAADIYAILMKGQGIAQCYKRPLWRTCGDIDLLLSDANYETTKNILIPLATSIDEELEERKHLALTIDGWTVELHGTLRTNLWNSLERMIDKVQDDVFYGGCVRSWVNGRTQVFLMGTDEDAVFVFVHILQHFFIEGIGLRQICDWCRLLYTYKGKINKKLLEQRLKSAKLMSKWKVFAAFAVDFLGMPADAVPLYDHSKRWKKKAKVVLALVMDSGNFGQGRDKSYKEKYSKGVRYMISFGLHAKDGYRRFRLFPAHALLMWWKLMMHGMKGVMGIGKNDGGL